MKTELNNFKTLKIIKNHQDKWIRDQYDLCNLFYLTGDRINEISQLIKIKQKKDIEDPYLRNIKGKFGKKIDMYFDEKIDWNTLPPSPPAISKRFRKLSDKLGFRVHAHGWRAGASTDAIEYGGCTPIQVSAFLNHNEIETTYKYLKVHSIPHKKKQVYDSLQMIKKYDFENMTLKNENEFLRKEIKLLRERLGE